MLFHVGVYKILLQSVLKGSLHMQSVSFKINAIENGWFEAELGTVSRRTAISASDKWGNDAARHLIHFTNKLLSGKISSGYVSFDEAPGTYILFIDNSNATTQLYILYSQLETCHWKNLHTHGSVALSDFLKSIPVKEVLLFAEIDLKHFADSIYREFDVFTDKKHLFSYEANWNTFPVKDFHKLESLIQEHTYPHFSYITA